MLFNKLIRVKIGKAENGLSAGVHDMYDPVFMGLI